jgi:hypothetical protein
MEGRTDGMSVGRTSVSLELDGPNKLSTVVGVAVPTPRSTKTIGAVDGTAKGETDGTLVGTRLGSETG